MRPIESSAGQRSIEMVSLVVEAVRWRELERAPWSSPTDQIARSRKPRPKAPFAFQNGQSCSAPRTLNFCAREIKSKDTKSFADRERLSRRFNGSVVHIKCFKILFSRCCSVLACKASGQQLKAGAVRRSTGPSRQGKYDPLQPWLGSRMRASVNRECVCFLVVAPTTIRVLPLSHHF